jgi:uncharacterized protein (TIGR02147 family)
MFYKLIMNVFSTYDYKKFLAAQIESHRDEYGYKSKLADAAGCQKSFFSQVVNAHVHLTPEHALGLANYWKLNQREREYFLELVNYGRAGTKDLGDYIKEKLISLRKENEHLGKRYSQPNLSVPNDLAAVYYSSWHYSAIHILLTIPQYQTPAKVAKRLHLPEPYVVEILRQLQALELVTKHQDGSWRASKKSLHLPKDSVFNSVNNSNWRQRATESSFRGGSDHIHYTGVYSLSVDDLAKLRELIFETIDRSRQIVGPSSEEELVCMSCDLFVV